MSKCDYTQLFRPLRIGRLTAKNRVVLSPMSRCRADADHVPTALMVDYYASRASMGLLVSESVMVLEGYATNLREPGLYSEAQVTAWRAVTDAVHTRGGLMAAQLYHGGRATAPGLVTAACGVVAPSAVPVPAGVQPCVPMIDAATGAALGFATAVRALSTAEVAALVGVFAAAAARAVAAGFDYVEVHAGSGYLIDQFLRDGSNRRTDAYGGGVEGRSRFLLEVVDAVVAVVGADRVGVRLTPYDGTNGVRDTDPDALLRCVCTQLNSRGIAYVNLLRGDQIEGNVTAIEKAVRPCFGGAIIASHGYGTPAAAEQAIAEGSVEGVAFGTLAVANPDLVWRLLSGAALSQLDPTTLYTHDAHGYTDYPICEPEGFHSGQMQREAKAVNGTSKTLSTPPRAQSVKNASGKSTPAVQSQSTNAATVKSLSVAPVKDRQFFSVSQPLLVGRAWMKNRLVMGPLPRQRCDAEGCATALMVDYYAQRVSFGLQVSDPCDVQAGYHGHVCGAAITTMAQASSWRKVTDAVHEKGGLIACQLHHAGRATVTCNLSTADKQVYGATAVPVPANYLCPSAFTADGTPQPYAQAVVAISAAQLDHVVDDYAQCARMAMVADFDLVEVHAGGGFLLDQFLRGDDRGDTHLAGGDGAAPATTTVAELRERCAMLDRVVQKVSAAVGGAFRVGVRLSPTDLSKGMSAVDADRLARVVGHLLQERKVAYVVLASGSDGYFHGPVPRRVAAALRETYTGVLFCDDNVSLAEADLKVREKVADGVCMTLAAVANADLMSRAIRGVRLAAVDMHTLYTHDAVGYTDYPTVSLRHSVSAHNEEDDDSEPNVRADAVNTPVHAVVNGKVERNAVARAAEPTAITKTANDRCSRRRSVSQADM